MRPLMTRPDGWSSCRIAKAVTDLPLPDSPPESFTRSDLDADILDRRDGLERALKGDGQVLDVQKRISHYAVETS